ncbi:MAG: DUF1792 domain-containing protein [Ignavibacteriales bacterium]|nr:MAG: DUF1792 domain-containing protein [Ignavibacteriales bacterium]
MLKYLFALVLYPLVIRKWSLPQVASIDETLDNLIHYKSSIARFGDGEFLYMVDKLNLPFQSYNERLSEILKLALSSNISGLLIGLPSGYHSLNNLTFKSKIVWRSHIAWTYPRVSKLLKPGKRYFNASFTRFYIEVKDKSRSEQYINKIRKIWNNLDVLLIEGEKSRLGVGNNLFNNANSVSRILAPKHDAFDRFDELFAAAMKYGQNKITLLALGPTATALAYSLALNGRRAIDVGNVDIEYEWLLARVTKKTKIIGKYTSEASGGRDVEDIADEKYDSQIIKKII